jgi:hypothetical protein
MRPSCISRRTSTTSSRLPEAAAGRRIEVAASNERAAQVPSQEDNTAKEKSQLAYRRCVMRSTNGHNGRTNLASRNLPETTARPFEFRMKAWRAQREARRQPANQA